MKIVHCKEIKKLADEIKNIVLKKKKNAKSK